MAPVDVRTWILDDHAGLAERFDQSIRRHIPVERWREQAGERGSSIAWLLLHTALHEDLAVSTAVRGEEPHRLRWVDRLGLGGLAPHAGLGEAEDPAVTAVVDPDALMAFAAEVHADAHEWMATVDLAALDDVPPAGSRIDELAGVSAAAVPWLHAMWEAKPVAWFVRWEAIGHRQGHLGEMTSVRNRLGLSPF
jgi:hypothetical protein